MSKPNLLLAGILLALTVITGVSECYAISKPPPTPTPAGVPDDKFDLKGLFLGMSKKDIRGLILRCFALPSCFSDDFCISKKMTLAGRPVEGADFLFKKNKITTIQFSFDSSHSSDIADAFTLKHGKPLLIKKNKVQKALGMSLEQVEMIWNIKDAVVIIKNIDEKITRGSLTVRSFLLDAQTLECIDKTPKKNQNDL